MSNTNILAITTLCVLCGLTVSDTKAATVLRRLMVNASGVCQSALPVFDVNIRKRPKAVQNEGDTSAFVTCTYYSFGSTGASVANPTAIVVSAAANDGVADTLSCTGVNGYSSGDFIPFAIKTVNLSANGEQAKMIWTPSDFGGTERFPSGFFSISCNLNPGVGINDGQVLYMKEIGA